MHNVLLAHAPMSTSHKTATVILASQPCSYSQSIVNTHNEMQLSAPSDCSGHTRLALLVHSSSCAGKRFIVSIIIIIVIIIIVIIIIVIYYYYYYCYWYCHYYFCCYYYH